MGFYLLDYWGGPVGGPMGGRWLLEGQVAITWVGTSTPSRSLQVDLKLVQHKGLMLNVGQ